MLFRSRGGTPDEINGTPRLGHTWNSSNVFFVILCGHLRGNQSTGNQSPGTGNQLYSQARHRQPITFAAQEQATSYICSPSAGHQLNTHPKPRQTNTASPRKFLAFLFDLVRSFLDFDVFCPNFGPGVAKIGQEDFQEVFIGRGSVLT